MLRYPRSAASATIAVLAASAVVPPAVSAATAPPPPRYETRGLLDGLLGIDLGNLLGQLLGGTEQNQLQQLLNGLLGGQAPTPEALAPLTDILRRLGATQGLPADVQQLVQQLTGLLQNGGLRDPLSGGLLAPVAELLRQLAATQGLPAAAAQLLTQLADVLGNRAGGAGLPIVGDLGLDGNARGGLQTVLDSLLRGGQPTGALLAPIIPLLRQIAAAPGLPAPLQSLIDQLIDTIQRTTGALDPLVTSQLSTVLSLLGNTPGVSRETRTIIERTTTALTSQTPAGGTGGGGGGGGGSTGGTGGGGSGGTPTTTGRRAATARDRAVVKKVTVNRARTVASIRVACPSSAPATCATTLSAKVRGKRAAAAKSTRIGAGRSKVVKLRLTRAARRSLRAGGKVSVTATTRFGTQRFTAKGTATVRRAR
jgi:hypothetical protein